MIKALVLVKNRERAFRREKRGLGYWSYPVAGLEWDFLHLGKSFELDTRDIQRHGYDIIVHEDAGNYGRYIGGAIPVAFVAIDSTNSRQHYQVRLKQARKADLVLVDHDRLRRFKPSRKPVYRWAYPLNERLYFPRAKQVDVAFHCAIGGIGGEQRRETVNYLRDYCEQRGYSLRWCGLDLDDYARSLAEAHIVVNVPRVPDNRPHRVMQAMGVRSCLLTAPLPPVSGEDIRATEHYEEYHTLDELGAKLSWLLESGHWSTVAHNGFNWVRQRTWTGQAARFQQIINKEFGI